MTINVYLDSASENMVDSLALHAEYINGLWNGWAVPVVTAREFRNFIGAWARNDPNGTWRVSGITESPDHATLTYVDTEHAANDYDTDVWVSVGTNASGETLYAIDGWCFITADHYSA